MEHEEFRKNAYRIIDEMVDYYKNTSNIKPTTDVKPGYLAPMIPQSPPKESESFDQIHKDFYSMIVPGMTHWQSADFFSYFPCSLSYPSMLAEMYASMFNSQNFDWVCNPAASELEDIMMNWLAQVMGLDDSFISNKSPGCGTIQSNASEGTLVSMITARNMVIKRLKKEGVLGDNEEWNTEKLVMYTSDQAHSSVPKGAKILNIKIRCLEGDETGALQPETLRKQIECDIKEGLIPFHLTVCYGSTGIGAVDNILGCASVAKEYGMWVHVDGAWAGVYWMLPEFQVFDNFKTVDSLVFNPHKMMLIHFDCSAFWTKHKMETIEALTMDASYFTNFATMSGLVTDYKNLQIPLGRKFRSLKLWFVLRSYGSEGLKRVMYSYLDQTKFFIDMVEHDNIFEITHPSPFSLVCIRPRPSSSEESNEVTNKKSKWINEKIIEEGRFMIAKFIFKGKYILRVSFGNGHNTEASITNIYNRLKELALDAENHI